MIGVQLERVTAIALKMLIARTVAMGRLSASMSTVALALPPKPTEAAVWSKTRFKVYVLNVGMVSESQSFSVS